MKEFLNKYKNVKSLSILVVPDTPGIEAASKRVTVKGLLIFSIIYTVIIFFLGFFLLTITPVGGMILPQGTALTQNDLKKIDELNKRMFVLGKELEGLKSTNERLKYAIMLGDSALFDSLKLEIDTLRKNSANPYSGDIFSVFNKLFFDNQSDSLHGSFFFVKPAVGFISRGFNPDKGHLGVDFVEKSGSPVYAAAGGYAVFSGYTENDGYMIILAHTDDYITIYKHCSSLLKKQRDIVKQGEIIALSGNTGNTTGPHLHFEIWKNGKPLDPLKVLLNNSGRKIN